MAEHNERHFGPVITIQFMDDSRHEVHLLGDSPDHPYTWQHKTEGLFFKFRQKGRRILYPWQNIKSYEVYPYIEGGQIVRNDEEVLEEIKGYIVVAVSFMTGQKANYKITWGEHQPPTESDMAYQVLLDSYNNDTLYFVGTQLIDPPEAEECWLRIPGTAYLSVSWTYYTLEEIRIKGKKSLETEKPPDFMGTIIPGLGPVS